MPYGTNKDLPAQVRDNLPDHALSIYREAHNNALEEYQKPEKRRKRSDDPETIAHKVAWAAVKKEYKKGRDGKWIEK